MILTRGRSGGKHLSEAASHSLWWLRGRQSLKGYVLSLQKRGTAAPVIMAS